MTSRLSIRALLVTFMTAVLIAPLTSSADAQSPAAGTRPLAETMPTCADVEAGRFKARGSSAMCIDPQAPRLARSELRSKASSLGLTAADGKAAADFTGTDDDGADGADTPGPLAVDCPANELETNRFESCYLGEFAFVVRLIPSQQVIGRGSILQVVYGYVDNRARRMEHEVRLSLYQATGVVRAGVLATVLISCTTSCTPTTTPPPQLLPFRTTGYDSFRALTESPGTTTDFTNPVAMMTIQSTAPNPLVDEIGPRADVRCDSTPNVGPATGGCVYYRYKPTYDLSTLDPNTEEVAWHVWWAQNNLVTAWGREGYGPALTRTRDRQLIRDNRTEACRAAPSPRPPGQSCDEYPFATTHEGASKNPDFSWHMIDARQNTAEGRDYRRPWYTTNRLLENDQFWVRIILPPAGAAAAPDWLPPSRA
ncbi:NucA/NucB deoxyribonuclease domain-containing protein [Streptomyces tauricus]|uniref:NucA/NucB deoxyribonuclease domain-containing protein n=1 Tax=Streptomyces tauricus TaxID=68274 RepID=UPI002244A0F8|nr:NucA/NucB deoxyribonuclease domain-containing protein [Streptomyces tauricus]MCW8102819.1 NucA/NucB deoxyribonuclease domain-containing protein [Streptomyces tauricus]